jgi:hypothetical protein
LPSHAVGNAFFTVIDLYVYQNVNLIMPPGNDGQKIGVRWWCDVGALQVTWPENFNNGNVVSTPSFSPTDPSSFDYMEFLYTTAANKWTCTLVNIGIPIINTPL